MSFHGFFLNADYGRSPLADIYAVLFPTLQMRKRKGVWEVDPRQFERQSYDFETYYVFDELAPVDETVFLAHSWDFDYRCRVCGMTQKEVVAGNCAQLRCPGPPRKGLVTFFNNNDSEDWTAVHSDSYVTVEECDDYLKGRE